MEKRILLQAVFLIALLLPTRTILGQFQVSGEFRPRFEYRDGYSRLRDSSNTGYPVLLGRNRIIFDYQNEQFSARFSLQHAYVFGENNYASDTITKNTVNIYEGWFRYAFSKTFAIKVGRSELVYDDGRLLGNSNWNAKGASHDIALLQWENKKKNYRGDFGIAINNVAPATPFLSSYPLKNYKYMAFLYEQHKFMQDKLKLSMIAVLDVHQQPSSTTTKKSTKYDTLWVVNANHDTIGSTVFPVTTTSTVTSSNASQLYGRFTIGGTAGYQDKKLKLFFAGYFQGGHTATGRSITAGMFGGYASYQLIKPLTLLAGYDYLSGNNYSDVEGMKTENRAFSTLYSSNHGFYGYMDMFNPIVTLGLGAGLTDLYARLTYAMSEKSSLELTYRSFGITHNYLPYTPLKPGDNSFIEVKKSLGSEIDLMFIYKPVKSLEINAAYCFFLPTETMERLNAISPGNAEFAQYAYVMLTYKPTFFNSDKH